MFVGCHELSRTQQFSFTPFKLAFCEGVPPHSLWEGFCNTSEGGIFYSPQSSTWKLLKILGGCLEVRRFRFQKNHPGFRFFSRSFFGGSGYMMEAVKPSVGDFFCPLLRLGSPIPLADDKLTTSLWLLFQKCPKDIPLVFFSNWNKALFDLGRLLFFIGTMYISLIPHPSSKIKSSRWRHQVKGG